MKTLIVIPTYNEIENISSLVPNLLERLPNINILVVDDSSPDGTANKVTQMGESNPRVNLLLREKKEGLGRAYLAGFDWGLKNGFEYIVEMDADFSHRPEDLELMLSQAEKQDFLVGSRWVNGGGTKNWGLLRKIISLGGSFYARMILGFPLNDWTGGFNGWKSKVLNGIDLQNIQSNGYSFQIEMKYRALKNGFQGKEFPILFEDRRVG
ncbi:MAG: polyprenol monophosphomannose synthase, partial [Pseudomonadota bacterium]